MKQEDCLANLFPLMDCNVSISICGEPEMEKSKQEKNKEKNVKW